MSLLRSVEINLVIAKKWLFLTFRWQLPLIFLFVFSYSELLADNYSSVGPVKSIKLGSSKKETTEKIEDQLLPNQRRGSVDVIQEVYRKRTKVGFVAGEISGDTTEEGGTAEFVVYLQSRPISDVTLYFKSENVKEGKLKPGKVVFTPDNWYEQRTVTVIGQDDYIMDGAKIYDIIISVGSDGDFEYARLKPKKITVRNKDNDKAGFIVSKISASTNEAGGKAVFSIKLNSQPLKPVHIYTYSSDESEGQVENQKMVFSEENWKEEQLATVVGQDDKVEDGAVAYSIILDPSMSDDKNYDGLKLSTVDVVNLDNDRVGVIASKVKGHTVEDGTATSFDVWLRSEPISEVKIKIASLNLNEGFVKPGIITFTPKNWNKKQQVKVIGRDDSVDDGDRRYIVRLYPGSSGDPKYNRLKAVNVKVMNKDNDTAGISVHKLVKKSSEMGEEAKFSIKLNTEPMAEVKLKLRSGDESEGRIIFHDLVFTPQDWYIAKTVTIVGVDDELADGNQVYRIIIDPAESRDAKYRGMDALDPNFVNLDNDSIGFDISEAKGKTTEDGGKTSFDLRITSKPKADVVVRFVSDDKNEGLPQPQFVTFTANDWNHFQTVSVIGQADQEVDGDQEYTIITSVESEDPDYKSYNPKDVSVVNIDKNGHSIFVGKVEGGTTEKGGSVILPIRLNSSPQDQVRIDIVVSDPGEGRPEPARLFFDSQNWNNIQQAKIVGVNDDEQDGDQDYYVSLNPDSERDPRFKKAPSEKVFLKNLDDDQAGIIIDVVDGTADENGEVAKFAMRLSSQPTSSVVLIFNSDNLAEAVMLDHHAEFYPGNWNKERVIRVKGLSDSKVDGDQIFHVISQGAVSKDPNYNGVPFNNVRLINKDLDIPKFNISDISGDTNESGGQATFKVSLNSKPKYKVALSYGSSDKTEGLVKPKQLTFSPDDWDKEQTVRVIGVDDGYKDYDQDYKILFSPSKSEDLDYKEVDSPHVLVTNFDRKRWSAGLVVSQFYMMEDVSAKITDVGSYGLQIGYMFNRIIELDVFIAQGSGSASEIVYNFETENPMDYTLDVTTLSLGSKFFLDKSFVDIYAKAGFDLHSWKLTAVNRLDNSASTQGSMTLGGFMGAGFDFKMPGSFKLMVMSLELAASYAGDGLSHFRWAMAIKYPF